MANLFSWITSWLPSRPPSSPSSLVADEYGAACGMEAAFTTSSRPMALDEHPPTRPLDTDWAIHRLNSRSSL